MKVLLRCLSSLTVFEIAMQFDFVDDVGKNPAIYRFFRFYMAKYSFCY